MNWPTILSAAVAAACLTLAGMHLFVWWKDRAARANLAFSGLAASVALFTWCCLLMMRAATVNEFAWALWWSNFTVFLMVAGVVAFISTYFRTARPWLGHAAWIARLVTLIAHIVRSPNSDFDSIVALRSVSFLGDQVSVVEGLTSLWYWTGQFSLVLLLWFIVDACVALWRVGDHVEKRRAIVIGVPTAAFVLLGAISAAVIFGQVVALPHLEFVPFLGILLAMAYELSSDVLRAARLARELQASEAALRESDHRMTLAAEAARMGMWIWDLRSDEIWLTDKCRDILGFAPGAMVSFAAFTDRLHPDDRARVESETRLALKGDVARETHYRLTLPGGAVRWVAAHLRVDRDASGRAERMLGICIDVTEQRNAEIAARELGGRLINAQEDERKRIARDLHDDLSQRLAVMAVDLELLSRTQTDRRQGVVALATQVQELASEVHKVAYQLHPAKLDQLGLEIAAHRWCRDITEQSGVQVEFEASDVPEDLPADIALCVYRILQESLRNVVRHSQATTARVELTAAGDWLRLVVTDSGRGFDLEATRRERGLGLLGMQERAHLLRGSVEVHSRPGQGTRVTVSIPYAGADVNALSETMRAPAASGNAGPG